MMDIPEKIFLYRIIHIDNLDYILKIGKFTCPNHHEKDLNYIGIGDETLILSRSIKQIQNHPNGTFLDYVSFYFGNRSPILYSIWKGFNNVTRRPQSDIIYLVTTFEKVNKSNRPFVFFDGHGYNALSQEFSKEEELINIDWLAVKSSNWGQISEDDDLKRRKQAELLVYQEISLEYIIGIAVYNFETKEKINLKLSDFNVNLKCEVMEKWYY